MKYCTKCGRPVADDVMACPYCNEPLPPVVPNSNQQQNYSYGNGYYNQGGYSQSFLQNDLFASDPRGKSRGVMALLALFLGELGVQYFYIGKVGAGLLTILLMLVTCGLWGIVVLIQAIMLFCMTNQDFERKFIETDSTFPLF